MTGISFGNVVVIIVEMIRYIVNSVDARQAIGTPLLIINHRAL